jgi:hypothetical protein
MEDKDTKSIMVSRNNYILLMRRRHALFERLKETGLIKNVSFDDVITELLIGED